MELHGDDPDHFELLIKFIYTNDYDVKAILKLAAQDKVKRILIPIGIHVVADKYEVAKVSESAAEDVRSSLEGAAVDVIKAAVRAHYEGGTTVDGTIGKLIAQTILEDHSKLIPTAEFQALIKSQPAFGADVALAVVSSTKQPGEVRTCSTSGCQYKNISQHGMRVQYCQRCGAQLNLRRVPRLLCRAA